MEEEKKIEEKMFTERLNAILKDNNIKKVQLADYMGINVQTIYNWLSKGNNYTPNWVCYAYKLNIFLKNNIKNFNPMDLYLTDKEAKIQAERRKQNEIDAQKYSVLRGAFIKNLSNINKHLCDGEIYGLNFYYLLSSDKFYKTISQIYLCIFKNDSSFDRTKLKNELFEIIFKFLKKENNRKAKKISPKTP